MKGKLLLLAGLIPVSLFAQQRTNKSIMLHPATRSGAAQITAAPGEAAPVTTARTSSTAFVTETFGSGTRTTLPTGWTAQTVAGLGTWKWANRASGQAYSIGAINSTTASDGWLLYDSDSIGANNNATVLEASITSPNYVCSGRNLVGVSFQQWFRRYQDTCILEVSNNGGTSWTRFPIGDNNRLSNTSALPANPTTTTINVSSVAANQANVQIRFRYKFNGNAGGGYNWLVDDVQLVELDSVDIGVSGTGAYGPWGDYGSAWFITPKQLLDSIQPYAFLFNQGGTNRTNVGVTAEIFQGGTSLYRDSLTLGTLGVNAKDSLVSFRSFLPTSYGAHRLVITTYAPNDAVPANNSETVNLSVTDSVWSQNVGTRIGRTALYRPASGGNPAVRNAIGTRFDVPPGKLDTVVGWSVAFDPSTTIGSTVVVQLYKTGTSGYDARIQSRQVTLDSSTISSVGNIKYAYFTPDLASSLSGFDALIIDSGTYAAVVVVDNPTTSTNVTLLNTPKENTVGGYFGQSGTSTTGSGSFEFGDGTFATGTTSIPFVRMHVRTKGGVSTKVVSNDPIAVRNAYPNPASDKIFVPVSGKGQMTVLVSNALGQIVTTTTVDRQDATPVTLSVATLPSGVYNYKVVSGTQVQSGKFVVAH